MADFIDITGQKYGKLLVIERVNRPKHIKTNGAWWLCKCDCGNETTVLTSRLNIGKTKSCGCWHTERIKKHGKSYTRIYKVWTGIKDRTNPNNIGCRNNYRKLGVDMCEEWRNSFETFYEWSMANGYKDNLTIDRINNDGNYEPSNCRWATATQQAKNRSTNVLLTYNGETYTMSEWADQQKIPRDTLRKRITCGWSIEKALTTPVKKRKDNTYKN